jgi:hypothetical protein
VVGAAALGDSQWVGPTRRPVDVDFCPDRPSADFGSQWDLPIPYQDQAWPSNWHPIPPEGSMSQQAPRRRRRSGRVNASAGPTTCLRCDDTFESWDRRQNRLCPGCCRAIAAGRALRPDTACLSAGGATDMRGDGREVVVREDRLCTKDSVRPGHGVMRVAAGVPPEEGATVVRHAARNGPRPLDTPVPEAVHADAVGTGGRAHPGSLRMNPHARSVTREHPFARPWRENGSPSHASTRDSPNTCGEFCYD